MKKYIASFSCVKLSMRQNVLKFFQSLNSNLSTDNALSINTYNDIVFINTCMLHYSQIVRVTVTVLPYKYIVISFGNYFIIFVSIHN